MPLPSPRRPFAKIFLFAVAVFFFTASVHAQQQPPAEVRVGEKLLFLRVNQERTQRGLNPLQWDPTLYAAAQFHADWMAKQRAISHQFPGEPDLSSRAADHGAQFNVIAENVAIVGVVADAHNDWMNSPGHRANILDPRLNAVAIAFVQRDGRYYVVQDFSRSAGQVAFSDQEKQIAQLLRKAGIRVSNSPQAIDAARRTCGQGKGWAGPVQPNFTMHWSSGDLSSIPQQLNQQIASGRYSTAVVGACSPNGSQSFTEYSIAVMLFSQPLPPTSQSQGQDLDIQ